MGEGTSGKSGGVKVIPKSAATKFASANNGSGETYTAGTNSKKVKGADSWETPNGHNMLETTDFWDSSVDNMPGMKTGEWSVSGNYNNVAGLADIQAAHDAGEIIEIAATPDESNHTTGYECTAYVSEFSISTDANDKVTFDATFVFADGDGWSRLA
ncbi:MAG: phage tail tube protein [Bradymonadaceae bacterium]